MTAITTSSAEYGAKWKDRGCVLGSIFRLNIGFDASAINGGDQRLMIGFCLVAVAFGPRG